MSQIAYVDSKMYSKGERKNINSCWIKMSEMKNCYWCYLFDPLLNTSVVIRVWFFIFKHVIEEKMD